MKSSLSVAWRPAAFAPIVFNRVVLRGLDSAALVGFDGIEIHARISRMPAWCAGTTMPAFSVWARVIGEGLLEEILTASLGGDFAAGKHVRALQKTPAIEAADRPRSPPAVEDGIDRRSAGL